MDPRRRASSSSSCRAGCRARARPGAAWRSRSRRCSACGWSRAPAGSGTSPASRRAGSRRSRRATGRRPVRAVGVDVQRDFEALRRCTSSACASVSGASVYTYEVLRTHSQSATMQPGGLLRDLASKRPAVPPPPWSSPVITTAAFSPRGRYQKRGSGARSCSICRRGSRAGAAARRLAGSAPCSG